MSAAAAIILIAQSAAPTASDKPLVREYVTASATVVRPAIIRVRRDGEQSRIDATSPIKPQRSRDRAGTVWIEFN
ncbi:MAG: hypothetical protein AAGK01_02670 [Pseudomonadota bacterium]